MRTRKIAEVFTPVWLCNKMNSYADEQWFGQKNVFNTENEEDRTWNVNTDKIQFNKEKPWTAYVDSRRLGITCGEAPYLVSRYDVTTGELILPLTRRIGLLDRKLRVINENADKADEWLKWALRAFQSCYGYEYQGDNLLIARINLIMTFCDYYRERMMQEPDETVLKQFANVISWNIWQMDGLKDTVPLGKPRDNFYQMSLFDTQGELSSGDGGALSCRIFNWRSKESLICRILKKGMCSMGKKFFDFCIGNPPYQKEFSKDGNVTYAAPVYNEFMDAANEVAKKIYRLTDKMHKDYPEAISQLSQGHPYDMSTNIFDRLPQIFYDDLPADGKEYIQILGWEQNQRVYKYVRADYVNRPDNLYQYKLFLPSGNGNGKFGETLTSPVEGGVGIGATETFISVGSLKNIEELHALTKYIKSKFARAMIGVLKTTQHLTPAVWQYVPLQDFTSSSDIDWSKSVHEIDRQLYREVRPFR